MARGLREGILDRFEGLASRLGHPEGEDGDCDAGEGAEEEVCAVGGAGEEDGGGEGDEPVCQLVEGGEAG